MDAGARKRDKKHHGDWRNLSSWRRGAPIRKIAISRLREVSLVTLKGGIRNIGKFRQCAIFSINLEKGGRGMSRNPEMGGRESPTPPSREIGIRMIYNGKSGIRAIISGN